VGNQKKKSGSSSATDERFLQECAKRLRKQPTVAEEHMRHHLLASDGWIFQHPIRFTGNGEEMGAILDFYNPKRKLAVELDGNIHQGPKQKRRDVERTRTLAKHGITVLRFRNDEACFDTRRVLADIAAAETPSKPRRVATRKKPRATREPFIPVVKISPVVTKRHEPVIEDGLCCHELLPGTCSFCR
jgi:very-short-patch-repair endonuclease